MRYESVGLIAIGALFSAPVMAQQAEAEAPPPTGLADASEIIVTATRRAESVQRVPLSVDVVTPLELQSRNLSSVTDLPRLVPSLSFTNSGQSNTQGFTIRGVSTYAFADTLEQSVGVNIDGVPVGRPAGSFGSLVDLERVEVLQGPQGLLFGKNASAGLVAIYTAKPKFEDSLSGRFAFASRNEVDAEAAANVQLIDNQLAARVTAWSFTRDGFIKAVATGRMVKDRDDKGVRGRLRYEPIDALEINLMAEYTRRDAECCAFTSVSYPAGSIYGAADAAQGITPGLGNFVTGSPLKPGVPKTNYARAWNYAYFLQADYDLGGAVLTSLTGHRNNRESNRYDGTVANIPYLNDAAPYEGRYTQWTQELRLTSDNDSALRYVLGLFFYDLDLTANQTQGACQPAGNPACTPTFRSVDVTLDSRSYAAFGELNYSITDAFRVSAGGRVTYDDLSGTYNRFTPPGASPIQPPLTTQAETDHTNFSWRVGAQYDLDPTKMLYATYATGYKGPGFGYSTGLTAQVVALTGGIVPPETTQSFELGLKTRWPEQNLTLNLALFHSTFKDFQTTVGIPGTTPLIFAVVNADEIRTQGAQLDATWRPVDGLELSGNLAYTDAEFVRFPNSACYAGQTAAQGCVGALFDVSGFPLTDAPKWRYTVGARYDIDVGTWGASYQVDWSYKSSVYWLAGNPFTTNDAYGLLNMAIGLTPPGEQLRITGFVRNLLKEQDFGRVSVSAYAPGGYISPPSYDTQRVFGIALNFNF